jgi:hypothetical protein
MNNLERMKSLAGLVSEDSVSADFVSAPVALKAHSWVEHELDQEQMKAAVWGLFMQYTPLELSRIHAEFKKAEAQSQHE